MFELVFTKSLELLERGGYGALFLLSILDRVLLSLIPAEVILPFAGFLVGTGQFDLTSVFLIVTVGNLIGDLVLFIVAAKGGRWILEKYGRYFFVSKHDLEHTDQMFAAHGGRLVILGRLIPIVRTFIAIPAGIAQMPLLKFIGYTVVGSLPWNVALIFIGLKSGENWNVIKPYTDKIDILLAGAVLAIIIWYVVRHRRHKHLTHE